MNRGGWLKHSWLDKDNRVVHTTMSTRYQTADDKMPYILVYQLAEVNALCRPTFRKFAREIGGDRPHFQVCPNRAYPSAPIRRRGRLKSADAER